MTAVRDRKARLEHVEGQLSGIITAKDLDLSNFLDRVGPVLKNWRDHLRKNPHVAQQVLRKIIPERLRVSLDPRGGWRLDGAFEYDAVLADLGLDAVRKIIEQVKVSKSSGSGWASRWATPRSGASASRGGWTTRPSGTVTNLSARLCGEAQSGQVLVSQGVYTAVQHLVEAEPVGALTLKGFLKPVPVYNVVRVKEPVSS